MLGPGNRKLMDTEDLQLDFGTNVLEHVHILVEKFAPSCHTVS